MNDVIERTGTYTWSDSYKLGFHPMDTIHEEFFKAAFRTLTASDTGALAALDELIAHLDKHFSEEEKWMNETAFPPRECHIAEHKSVMDSALEVRELIASGNAEESLCSDFANYLFSWFPGHADYLDSALAAWMCKIHYGGKPVMLRRKN